MTLAAGKLRHRVDVQRLQYEQDSAGDPIQNEQTGELRQEWVTLATVWAAVEPLSAREFVASGANASEVSTRITLRWQSSFKASDRLVHNGVVYNIKGILSDLDSGREYVTLPCSQGASDIGE